MEATINNILDKSDQSQLTLFNGKTTVSRTHKFSWTPGCGVEGTFMKINKRELGIDGRYQREAISRRKIVAIAKDWDWLWFGVISVVMRDDGSLWIFDGGHRVRAAMMRADIDELPCVVHMASDLKAEARAFIGVNTAKTSVSAISLHKAAVVSDDDIAKFAENLLDRHNYSVSDSRGKGKFHAIATLRGLIKQDRALTEKVFRVCADIAQGAKIADGLLRGLFVLERRLSLQGQTVLSGQWFEKLRKAGIEVLGLEIQRKRAVIGKGGALVEASALLDIINHRRQNRFTL